MCGHQMLIAILIIKDFCTMKESESLKLGIVTSSWASKIAGLWNSSQNSIYSTQQRSGNLPFMG